MKKIFSLFLACCSIISLTFKTEAREMNSPTIRHLLQQVKECIAYQVEMPQKDATLTLLESLEKEGCTLEKGSDDLRVKFVNLQGCMEHVLACSQVLGEIKELRGLIHTPTPATPLCTQPEPLDQGLLDESIRSDKDKLYTVRSRAHILREYLHNGGILYVVYPKGGLEKRTAEQQAVYMEELKRYPGKLIDWPLNTTQLDPEMLGATYFFCGLDGRVYVFSIKGTQVNDPKQEFEWGLWFGPIESPKVAQRIENLFSYVETYGGPSKQLF